MLEYIKELKHYDFKPKQTAMIVTKQTPLQPKEIAELNKPGNINDIAKRLGLHQRLSIPIEIVRAYETLKNPVDLAVWGQDPRNRALHRLAVEANRGSFIQKQNTNWGTQYSTLVNFYLLAQPNYRVRERIPALKPLFHHTLFSAINHYDPQLQEQLSIDDLQLIRQAVLEREQKAPKSIINPRIQNRYNLLQLNWVVLLELWVCVPQLQHPNQLLDLLGHRPLNPPELFETPNDIT